MAITATFVADFASFKSAVDGAETKLKQFQSGAQQVEKALTRVGDAFSGRRILQEATLAVKAVTDIGGVTKLTANEQQRLNAQVTEALAKYRALGQQAPADLIKIKNETTAAAAATSKITTGFTQLSGVLGAFGVSLGLAGLVRFGNELLRVGDELTRVADRTGLTTDEVQKLQFIAEQSGNSLDQITGAINKLQAGLGSESKGVVGAVKLLGLDFKALKDQSPYEQLSSVATALEKVKNATDFTTASVELFGRSGAVIIPSLISDFQKLGEEAPKMSARTVKALDDLGDALNRIGAQTKVFAAETYTTVSKFFDQLIANLFFTLSGLKGFEAAFYETFQRIPGGTKVLDALGISTKKLREEQELLRQSAFAQTEMIGRADTAVRKVVPSILDFSDAAEKAANSTDKAGKKAATFAAELSILDEVIDGISGTANRLDAAFDRIADQELGDAIAEDFAQVAARLEEAAAAGDDFREAMRDIRGDVGAVADQLEGAFDKIAEKEEAEKLANSFRVTLLNNLEQLRRRVPELITDAFTGGGGLKGALKAIAVQLANAFLEPFIDSLIRGLSSGRLKRELASFFGGAATSGRGQAAAKYGLPSVLGFIPGLGGAPTNKAPADKVPVATNEPTPPPQAPATGTPITTAPGQPGYPGGSVTQSILTGGFRSPLAAGGAGTPVTNYNSVTIQVSAVDAGSFDRVWKEQMIPRLQLELMTNQSNTVTNINRVVAKRT